MNGYNNVFLNDSLCSLLRDFLEEMTNAYPDNSTTPITANDLNEFSKRIYNLMYEYTNTITESLKL